MEKNLPVPYKSQHESDSQISNNDCGPASLAMVLEFLGTPISVGEVLRKLGNPKGYTSLGELGLVASSFGYNVETGNNASFNDIKFYIDRGLPVIVVGGYGYLESTQDKNFKGSHIMVVCGYRADDGVYVNDPNFWGQFKKDGDHHNYTASEFFTFWRNENNKEGNMPNTFFVVSPKAEGDTTTVSTPAIPNPPAPVNPPPVEALAPEKIRVTADIGVRARTQPLLQKANIYKTLAKGTVLDVLEVVKGAVASDESRTLVSDVWYEVRFEGKDLYVWSLAVEPFVENEKGEEEVVPGPANSEDFLKGILATYKLTRDILKKNNMLPPDEPVGFWGKFRSAFGL